MSRRNLRPVASAVATGALLSLLPTASASAVTPVQFSLIQYSPPGPDLPVNNTKLNGEYVAIRNVTASGVTLTGWAIHDTTRRADHVYRFGVFRLGPRATVIVHTGQGRNGAAHRYWGRRATLGRDAYVWSNARETVYLRTPRGAVADTCGWRAEAPSGRTAC